jgi:hypothetical protein
MRDLKVEFRATEVESVNGAVVTQFLVVKLQSLGQMWRLPKIILLVFSVFAS